MNLPVDWLLSGPAYVQYRTRLDLLGECENSPAVRSARQDMLADSRVQDIIQELAGWPGPPINSHKSANQFFHKLNFLVDLGVTAEDAGMAEIVEKVMATPSNTGPFALRMNISTSHGGSGEDAWAWALCDAPLILYALTQLGMGAHPRVQKALAFLSSLVRENGWGCEVSPELENFRGPGRKLDPCPFGNLAMLKALSLTRTGQESASAAKGVETILNLWEHRQERHPYLFYMGTDFCKLKAPLIWYDLLHVLDVLSRYPAARRDARFNDLLAVLQSQQDQNGGFTAGSIYTAYQHLDFGQKKAPSPWITFLAWRIFQRTGENQSILP